MGYRPFKCCTLFENIGTVNSYTVHLAIVSSAILLLYCASKGVCCFSLLSKHFKVREYFYCYSKRSRYELIVHMPDAEVYN
jgi:hypothetical protein